MTNDDIGVCIREHSQHAAPESCSEATIREPMAAWMGTCAAGADVVSARQCLATIASSRGDHHDWLHVTAGQELARLMSELDARFSSSDSLSRHENTWQRRRHRRRRHTELVRKHVSSKALDPHTLYCRQGMNSPIGNGHGCQHSASRCGSFMQIVLRTLNCWRGMSSRRRLTRARPMR